jgi:hypothetical protein
MKTTAPELTQVPQAVWQELPPEHVEVEFGRAPELRPPARPPWPWEAFHSVPIRGTQPGS